MTPDIAVVELGCITRIGQRARHCDEGRLADPMRHVILERSRREKPSRGAARREYGAGFAFMFPEMSTERTIYVYTNSSVLTPRG